MSYVDFGDSYVPNIPDQILRRIAYIYRQVKKQMQSEGEVTTTPPPYADMDLTVSPTTQPPQESVSEPSQSVEEVAQEEEIQDQIAEPPAAETIDDDDDRVQIKRRRRKKDEQTN